MAIETVGDRCFAEATPVSEARTRQTADHHMVAEAVGADGRQRGGRLCRLRGDEGHRLGAIAGSDPGAELSGGLSIHRQTTASAAIRAEISLAFARR